MVTKIDFVYIWPLCLGAHLLIGCSSSLPPTEFRGGHYGGRDAGKEVTIIYQSLEDVLSARGIGSAEAEIEKSFLPKGGRLLVGTKKEMWGGHTGPQLDISNQRQKVQYININQDGQFLCECSPLIPELPDASVFESSMTFESCNIGKPIKGSFQVLLLNFEKSPIGKYTVRLE